MNAPIRRRTVLRDALPGNAPLLALQCTGNVYRAVDRRMPEAGALAVWLAGSAAAFGLPESAVPDDDGLGRRSRHDGVTVTDWNKIGTALRQAAAGLPATGQSTLEGWVAAVGRHLALDELETRILALALHYRLDQCIERLWDATSDCRGRPTHFMRDADLIALLLAASRAEVASRLAGDAKLLTSGALYLGSQADLSALERLVSLIRRDVPPAADIYDQLLGAATAAPLAWDAFAHLGREAEVAAEVLRTALAGGEAGVNILLYGPPGTGKTCFAATLATRVGARLRPVAEADDDGDEPDRDRRLAGLRLAQILAEPGRTVLLFDEAEDLFLGRRPFHAPRAGSRVFIHRLLERMAVPVIWTANDIGALGPAVLRRMTMCLELRVPNLATRTVLWRRLGDAHGVALCDAEAARLARLVPAAPAVAATALRAARLAGGGAETARLIVEGVARAVRGGGLPAPEPEADTSYDPALVNADGDLIALEADPLRPNAPRAVSFLLAGPPGAGKSAWVRHLAGRMGLPVLQKRASDLLDPYVGGTEQNIAGAFAEARETQAFLVFDEADSLLLERGDAVRIREISQVNEMLTWMERHPLPFACTTNAPDVLDPATARRFLFKVRFLPMDAGQIAAAFIRAFGVEALGSILKLELLTPGDFAVVARKAEILGVREPLQAARWLEDEVNAKPQSLRRKIGF